MNKVLISSVLTFFLIGCGGSSGKKAEDNSVLINGVAVDDLILNGKVTAYDNNMQTLATGRTDSKEGNYTINIKHNGLVLLKVTCDDKSMFYNQNTKKQIPCSKDIALQSAVDIDKKSKKVTANISPVSDLVVKKMGSSISKESFADARAKIGLLFNVDPIANKPTQGAYKKVIDAIHKVAKDENRSIMQVLSKLSKDIQDDSVGEEATTKSLVMAMKEENLSNLLTKKGVVKLPENAASLDDIEMSKEFFAKLREQINSFAENGEFSKALDNEAKMFSDSFTTVSESIDPEIIAKTFNMIIDLSKDQNAPKQTIVNGKTIKVSKSKQSYNYTIDGGYKGRIDLPDNIKNKDFTDFTTLKLKIDGSFPSTTQNSKFILKTDISLKRTDNGAILTLSEASVSNSSTSLKLSDIVLSSQYTKDANNEIDFKSIKLESFNISGESGKYSINGEISIPSYVTNSSISKRGFTTENRYGDEEFYNSGIIPSKAIFTGVLASKESKTKIDGKLSLEFNNAKNYDFDKNDQELNFKADFSGEIDLPNLTPLIGTFDITKTENQAKIDAKYSYKDIVINTKGTFDNKLENGMITFTNQSGLKISLVDKDGKIDQSKSTITKDSKLIGTIQEREDGVVIKYIDGTFESAF